MPDSTNIDAAILAALNTDAVLLSLLPDRFWFDEARPNATRFGIVSLVDETDVGRFEGRSHEEALYLVRVTVRTTEPNAGSILQDAAARVDALLEGALLTAAGYDPMVCQRESRIRYTETDVVDPAIRFMHCGGHYRIAMSVQ